MEYRTARIGRVFVIRFDHGDDVLAGIDRLVREERIKGAWFHLFGGIIDAEVVTGPKEPVMPPEPVWDRVEGAHEVVGLGSVFWEEKTPRIHCHTIFGHHGTTLCACTRRRAKVYLIVEAYLVELTDCEAGRPWFAEGGFNRLTFGRN